MAVFDNYTKPEEMADFNELNIIYGWNYSGKTTISRIFQALETKTPIKDFEDANFSLNLADGNQTDESNLQTFQFPVFVFNTDFVKENLRWDGSSFAPILLLGDESIDAQEKIDKNDRYIERCLKLVNSKVAEKSTLENRVRSAKADTARNIKRTLGIVEAFTAVHLSRFVEEVQDDPDEFIINDEKLGNLIRKANSSSTDMLPILGQLNLLPSLQSLEIIVGDSLSTSPSVSQIIQHLVENPEISDWVRTGIKLHVGKERCEFCLNSLSENRVSELESHFSKELQIQEENLNAILDALKSCILEFKESDIRDFYESLREEVISCQKDLSGKVIEHNNQIDIVVKAVEKKLRNPFSDVLSPSIDVECDSTVEKSLEALNMLRKKNDDLTNEFDQEKLNAIKVLKQHYSASFVKDFKLLKKTRTIIRFENHNQKLMSIVTELRQSRETLEAQISNAQLGREEINQYIEKFLVGSNIEIEVIHVEENERFHLTRNSKTALNLSEGEKTAIAFAFFLAKLKEAEELSKIIVYIDDPVSSLDNNHLFQLNAVIREYFFINNPLDNPVWKLSVSQLFISTHSYEFLNLLRELPMQKNTRSSYYYVKRTSTNSSSFGNMPASMKKYSSEYQYLWSLLYDFYKSADKDNIELLLGIPNSIRRFVELYTYAKIPSTSNMTVDQRASKLFGPERSKRLLKVLHYFSHSNNIKGLSQNSDMLCDIEAVVNELVDYVKADSLHYEALMENIEA